MLPPGFRLGDNDTRILAVARNLAAEGRHVTLVSKDLPLRVKASAVGLVAEEYLAEWAVESGWTGMAEVEVDADTLDRLYHEDQIDLDVARDLPVPHRSRAAVRAGIGSGPGDAGEAGPAGAR